MSRRVLVSFANSPYKTSLIRLAEQAQRSEFFSDIFLASESDLDPEFLSLREKLLRNSVRGYGYSIWRPQLIWQVARELRPGDLLVWLDAGSHIVNPAREALSNMSDIAHSSPSEVLAFKAPQEELALAAKVSRKSMAEKCWTKGDVFDYFGVRNDPKIANSGQIASGAIFFRIGTNSRSLIEEWLRPALVLPSLFDDSPSLSRNFSCFHEHRHDQSVFSVAGKISGIATLSWAQVDLITEAVRKRTLFRKVVPWSLRNTGIQHLRDLR